MKRSQILMFALIALLLVVSQPTYAQDSGETYVIGNLSFFGNDAFAQEMAALGYVEGQNITYLYPSYEEYTMDMTPEESQEVYVRQIQAMVDAGADVFVTNTDSDVAMLRPLVGDETPIVFARADDPVATGAVQSLVSPGYNTTGTMTNKPHERRLQILTEVLPSTDKVYYFYSPFTLEAETVLAQVQVVADELNVEIIPIPVPDSAAGLDALNNMPEDVDWVFLTPNLVVFYDPLFTEAMISIAQEKQVGISWVTDDPMPGYLVGYGPSMAATDRQAAQIVDRILRGANPADLPVQTAENYLLINLETAEALGLEVPVGILRQADTIIRPGYVYPGFEVEETTE
ncbi:MAG: hypothetical protein GX573_05010 [Chloroflexi bacterium]|nr:hypothetical protein [Chloroflexota bacterium]